MRLLNDRDLGYIGGLLDGEGHIGLYHGSYINVAGDWTYNPFVNITNTYVPVLQFCQDITCLGKITPLKTEARNCKQRHRWVLSTPEMKEFLPIVKEVLIIKAEQADLLLEYFEKCHGIKDEGMTSQSFMLRIHIYNELALLNRRGL